MGSMRRMGGRRVRRSTGAHADINARMISSPRSRNHPRFVTGAHASHQTPARCSCDPCDPCGAWAVVGWAPTTGRAPATAAVCIGYRATGRSRPQPGDDEPTKPLWDKTTRRSPVRRSFRPPILDRSLSAPDDLVRLGRRAALRLPARRAAPGWPTRPIRPYPGSILRGEARRRRAGEAGRRGSTRLPFPLPTYLRRNQP